MHFKYTSLVLLAVPSLVLASSAKKPAIVTNPGFEVANRFGQPFAWTVSALAHQGGCTVDMQGLEPYAGNHSLRCLARHHLSVAQSPFVPKVHSTNFSIELALGYSAPPSLANISYNDGPGVWVNFNNVFVDAWAVCDPTGTNPDAGPCVFDGKAHYRKVGLTLEGAIDSTDELHNYLPLVFDIVPAYPISDWTVLLDEVHILYAPS